MRARLDRKMTQAQLADVLGVKQAMVSMFESGDERGRYGDDLVKRIEAWIRSGRGPRLKAPRGPRGPYRTRKRTTL